MDYHPFSVAVGASHVIPKPGNYLRYLSATTGAEFPTIECIADTGDRIILKPGQGVRMSRQWRAVEIKNRDAVGVIAGTLAFAGADEAVEDDRVSGEVSVIDGSLQRAKSNVSFIGGAFQAAVAAQFSHVQLWNPAGSGKRVIVPQMLVSSTVASSLNIRRFTAALTTLYATQNNPVSKHFDGIAGASVSQNRIEGNAALQGVFVCHVQVQAAGNGNVVPLRDAVVLEPGNGIGLANTTVNQDLTVAWELVEEPV